MHCCWGKPKYTEVYLSSNALKKYHQAFSMCKTCAISQVYQSKSSERVRELYLMFWSPHWWAHTHIVIPRNLHHHYKLIIKLYIFIFIIYLKAVVQKFWERREEWGVRNWLSLRQYWDLCEAGKKYGGVRGATHLTNNESGVTWMLSINECRPGSKRRQFQLK